MEKMDAVGALSALSQENRLDIYRLLVQAGPDGLAAGDVAAKLASLPTRCRSIWTACVTRASSAWLARAAR